MFYPKSPFIKNQLVESQLFTRNQPETSQLLEWLCRTPSTTTYRVNLLSSSFSEFSAKLQLILSNKYRNLPKIFPIKGIPEVVCISKVDEFSKLPSKHLKEIMVDSSCGAAILRGAHIFAPGVLSMQSGTKLGETVNVFVDLEGKCKKGTNVVFESEQKVFVGTGEVKMQRYQLYGENVLNHGVAIEMVSNISGVPSIGDLSSKEALLQNFPSIVCVRVLDPQPNEFILDMCAAPGNKTTHIVDLMRDTGTIVALDRTENKADLIRQKIKANDLKSVKVFAFDSTKLLNKNNNNQHKPHTPPFMPSSFDRILLDAPCSAIGNRPLLSSNLTPKMINSYPNVQKKLLINAVGLLKTNGVLVYSTCSVTEGENEAMVKWVIEQFPEMKLTEAVPIFGGPGIKEGGLTEKQRHLVQRFGSTDYNRGCAVDSIGFFIAKFVKIL